MGDNIMKNDHEPNYSFIPQNGMVHTSMTNMSVVPQLSSRPSTLPINGYANNSVLTPNDYNKLFLSTPELDDRLRGYTTPDLINAMTTQSINNGQSTPGSKMIEDMLNGSVDINNRPILSTLNPLVHAIHKIIPTNDYQKQDRDATYFNNRSNSQNSSLNRSISSSMNDNESTNSTAPSSPMSVSINLNKVKDELQHVPSIKNKFPHEPHDGVKKEKKRERNRQAAQKCRTRKLTRIAELQKRVNDLQGKNKDLSGVANCLKTDINQLEKQLQDHHTRGCTLMNGSTL